MLLNQLEVKRRQRLFVQESKGLPVGTEQLEEHGPDIRQSQKGVELSRSVWNLASCRHKGLQTSKSALLHVQTSNDVLFLSKILSVLFNFLFLLDDLLAHGEVDLPKSAHFYFLALLEF